MVDRTSADLSAARKRRFSRLLRDWVPLRVALRVAAWFKAPRQPAGAVGVVFDHEGRVLLVEHVFRTDFPWGLPGGWIERGEDPQQTVRREIEEELGLRVEIGPLLLSEQIGLVDKSTHPPHLGLAYSCRLVEGVVAVTGEVIAVEWANPDRIRQRLAPFQLRAIQLASAARGESRPEPRAAGRLTEPQ